MIKATLIFVFSLRLAGWSFCKSFTGVHDIDHGTDVFIGVHYAFSPPRFYAPVPLSGDQGLSIASNPYSNRCYQIGFGASSTSSSKDCLTLEIIPPSKPRGTIDKSVIVCTVSTRSATKQLLLAYVFFHGHCESDNFNSGEKSEYDGCNLVKASIALGSPLLYIGVNYCLGFLGFPSGEEVESHDALNLGLLDSRLSLNCLQQNIKFFGGDPNQLVVIGGQGSGVDMGAYHLLENSDNTNGLFRGAILHSGSRTSSSPVPRPNHTEWQKH
ncbi:uncharacterized protein RAG0_14228 [Rhynchosporium agropyri]|uniref:Carboxylesterase type B domain-containing protein n=1 Tax=Rhynchosporium agropyri TaxID=914238 RepID=A0A1E1LG90_9HELO|nr:uncharacterized protein RAG0_14228 [Rhynchosporium agropyri]